MSISTNPIPENTGWIVNHPMMGLFITPTKRATR